MSQRACLVTLFFLSTGSLLAAASGCANGPFSRPPGTMQQQQQRAVLFDPYPDRNIGPEVVGGRPRDFQQPRPEPVRNQWEVAPWLLSRPR